MWQGGADETGKSQKTRVRVKRHVVRSDQDQKLWGGTKWTTRCINIVARDNEE